MEYIISWDVVLGAAIVLFILGITINPVLLALSGFVFAVFWFNVALSAYDNKDYGPLVGVIAVPIFMSPAYYLVKSRMQKINSGDCIFLKKAK